MKEQLRNTIQKYSEGKLSLNEQIDFSEQLADPQNQVAEEVLNDDWKSQLELKSSSDKDFNPILDRVHHHIRLNENSKLIQTNWMHTFQRIAAILIIPLFITFLAYFYIQSSNTFNSNSYVEIECPMGARIKFNLPDGSTGFLNSGAQLKYPVQFKDDRKVELLGEAYFEVVHNAKRPFHVITNNLDIKVLGTTFNVIANEGEATEEIVLQSGKVDISLMDGTNLASLKPNEQLILDVEKQTIQKNSVEALQYTSWKDGKLVFRNENLQQVARRLSRWYNSDVIVQDNLLEEYTFHATFVDEPLNEVLKLLSLTAPIEYKEEKRVSNEDGIYQKRKIILGLNQSKINKFK